MTPELFASLGAFVTALGAILIAWMGARTAAKKDDILALQSIITSLQTENTRLLTRLELVERTNATLQEKVIEIGVESATKRQLLEARITLLEADNARLTLELVELRVKNLALERELIELRTREKRMLSVIKKIGKDNPECIKLLEAQGED